MKKYISDYLISREKTIEDKLYCEFEGCTKEVSDVHHILCSYRGSRKHSIDGSDLIGVCRTHHTRIHNNNKFDNRLKLLDRVKQICDFITAKK